MAQSFACKWEESLAEWVNCLNVGDPVQRLSDLPADEFITKLNKALSGDALDDVNSLTEFLQKFYPNYELGADDYEPMLIYSIFMHYICIIKKHQPLIEYMCSNLSSNTQILIKDFLVELASPENITRASLLETIQNLAPKDANQMTPKSSIECLKSRNSAILSPLQELFGTPQSLISEHHSVKIRKLRALLDTERYEKIDLQDELRVARDEISALGKKVEAQHATIVKLKTELNTAGNEVSPKSDNSSYQAEEKRLRSEIENLEKYISSLEEEQVELRRERNQAREEACEIDRQIVNWQRRALTAETAYKSSLEESNQQAEELLDLRNRYDHLCVLLDDAKRTQLPSDYSMESSSESQHTPFESLADVVELQLSEANMRNSELMKNLDCLQSQKSILAKQIESLERRLSNANEKNASLTDTNQELMAKVTSLLETQSVLTHVQIELEKSMNIISGLNVEKSNLSEQLEALQIETVSKSRHFEGVETENASLKKSFDDIQAKLSDISTLYESERNMSQSLKREADLANGKLAEVISDFNKLKAEKSSVDANLQVFDDSLNKCIQRLSTFIPELSISENDDFNTQIQSIMNFFEINHISFANEKTLLEKKCNGLQEELTKLMKEVAEANEKNVQSAKANNNLKKSLKSCKKKIADMEKSASEMADTVRGLNRLIEENCLVISELGKFKLEVQEKTSLLIAAEKENATLTSQREELNLKLLNVEEYLCALQSDHSLLKESSIELKNQLESKEKDLSLLRESFSELTSELQKVSEDFTAVSAEKEKLQAKLTQTQAETGEQLESLQAEVSGLVVQLSTTEEALRISEASLKNCKDSLECYKSEAEKKSKELQENIEEQSCAIERLASELSTKNEELEELKSNNVRLQSTETSVGMHLQRVLSEIGRLSAEVTGMARRIATLTATETRLGPDTESQETTSDIISKLAIIEGNISSEDSSDDHSMDSIETKQVLLDKCLEVLANEISAVKSSLEEQCERVHASSKEMVRKIHSHEVQIEGLQAAERELKSAVDSISAEKEVVCLEMKQVKLEMSKLTAEHCSTLATLEETEKSFLSWKERFVELQAASEQLQERNAAIEADLKLSNENLQLMNNVKSDLQNRLVDEKEIHTEKEDGYRAKISSLTNDLNSLNNVVEDLSDRLDRMTKANDQLNEQLSQQAAELRKLEEQYINVQAEMESERNALAENESVLEAPPDPLYYEKIFLEAEEVLKREEVNRIALEEKTFRITTLENALKHRDEELTSLTGEIAKTTSDLRQIFEEKSEMEDRLEKLRCESNSLKAQLEAVSSSHLGTLAGTLIELEREKIDLLAERTQNRQEIESLIRSRDELQSSQVEIAETHKGLVEQLERANEEKTQESTLRELAEAELRDAKRHLEEAIAECSKWEAEREKVLMMNDVLKNIFGQLPQHLGCMENLQEVGISDLCLVIEKNVGVMKGIICELTAEKDKAQVELEEMASLRSAKEDLLEQINHLESQLKNAQQELSLAKVNEEETPQLKNNSSKCVAEKTEILRCLEEIRDKNIRYETIITESDIKIKELTKLLEASCSSNGKKSIIAFLRHSNSGLASENSKLIKDCSTLKGIIDERSAEVSELSNVKEMYEKLLEENNKVHMELDTSIFKRHRDKDEFKRFMEKEKSQWMAQNDAKLLEVRNIYEAKLEKLKNKMTDLMNEDRMKYKTEHSHATEAVAKLKNELWKMSEKYMQAKTERDKLIEEVNMLRKSLIVNPGVVKRSQPSSTSWETLAPPNEDTWKNSFSDRFDFRMSSLPGSIRSTAKGLRPLDDTNPLNRSVKPDNAVPGGSRHEMVVEDEEGEIFSSTYLADMQAGKCQHGYKTNARRLTELQQRNALCLPHLKSSYPVETQFSTPSRFGEEDLKQGNLDLNNSIESRNLLTGEKLSKNYRGKTIYKKPGPPTPSKKGGRPSLQGSSLSAKDTLREQNDPAVAKTSKTKMSTPSRLKALFLGKSNSENNQPSTPKGRSLSLFRKPQQN